MDRLFSGLARFVVRHRLLVIVVWIGIAVAASATLPSLGSQINNNNSAFLPASAPSQQAATLATPLLGNIDTQSQVLVVVTAGGGTLTAADQQAVATTLRALGTVPTVRSVREAAVSPAGTAAVAQVEAAIAPSDISAQRTLVDRLQATLDAASLPSGVQLRLAGQVATDVANQKSSQKTGGRIQSLSLLLIIVLLLVIFRAPLAAVITLLPPAFALVSSTRFIGALGAHGLKISEITDLLLIVLLLGAGTDYGLFLVFRVREALRAGREPGDAVVFAMVRVGESISASAGTVIVALLTLLFASFGIYRDLGVPLALGMAVMLLAGLTLLPALLAVAGRAAFWPVRVGAAEDGRGWWGAVAAQMVRRPAWTLGLGVVAFGALATLGLGYRSAGFGGATSAPTGTAVASGNAELAHYFPASSANPANLIFAYARPVWTDPEVLVAAARSLVASGQVRHLAGPLDPNGTSITPADLARLHAVLGDPHRLPAVLPAGVAVPPALYNAYRATGLFISPAGTTVQFEAAFRAGGQQSTAALDATPAVRRSVAAAAAASGATHAGLAGEAAALFDVSNTADSDLVRIVPIAIVAIAVLLALVLRSLVAPLYLIVSVAMSYLAALGAATGVFIDLGGDSGLTFVLPFLMFIFLLALGEDYNILVMTRIREENHDRTLREAVVEAVARTGPTVTSAGVILAGTFAMLAVAGGGSNGGSGNQIQAIGFGLAIGILLDTFVVRTVLVPSTVALLGRWNWWPSRLGRSAHHLAGGQGATPEATPPANRVRTP